MTALFLLPPPVLTTLALVVVLAVVALVAWALQLMQAANHRQEFSLMLAGCMVCSAAVGLATVMVLAVTSPGRLEAKGLLPLQTPVGQELSVAADGSIGWDGEPPWGGPLQ